MIYLRLPTSIQTLLYANDDRIKTHILHYLLGWIPFTQVIILSSNERETGTSIRSRGNELETFYSSSCIRNILQLVMYRKIPLSLDRRCAVRERI